MLELFPTAVLDTSILTSVLVGLLVVWLLQEWLGWGLTALVVPGYLASVLAIQPLTAGVMIVEAVATWLVMVALSDAVPRWWPWFPLFGRDRFFLALLGSVAVRLGLEAGLLPLLSEALALPLSSALHSMGLVIVPLLAYAIWRNGPVRALPRLGVPLLLTWALLELVLLRWTNLSLASFELTYEDLALDFVSSPRAYMLLLCGAWLGSVANLRYGWDFGGIIVPGLLALCWLQPERLAATLGEALLVTLALRVLLRTPGLSRLNLTGGRLLMLGMLVGYLLKWGLGQTLGAGWPGLRLRQLFGFGYLLPTLMALRMVRSGDVLRTLVPSVLTSLGGFAMGTGLAWTLAMGLPDGTQEGIDGPELPATADGLLLAAHAPTGAPPLVSPALLAAGEPQLLHGAEGFGALWVRAEGQPLLVSARTGPLGMPEAALAVAEALDARAVQLCPPSADACLQAGRSLGLPVLQVAPGDQTALLGPPLAPDAAWARVEHQGRPAGASPIERGPEAGDSRLVLDPVARLGQAAAWRAVEPAPWRHPAWDPFQRGERTVPGAADIARDGIGRALGRWAMQEPDGEAALHFAAAASARLGATLVRQGDRAAVLAPGWRLLVHRGGEPLVVHLPFAEDATGLVPLSLGLVQATGAVAWVADSPPPWANETVDSSRPALQAALGLLAELGERARVVALEGLRDLQDPDGDVVLSAGTPVDPAQPLGEPLSSWQARLSQLGLRVALYDGGARRISFRAGLAPLREAARAGAGEPAWLGLYADSAWRERAQPLDGAHPLHDLLIPAGLPLWQVEADDLAGAVQAPGADWQVWRDRAAEVVEERSEVRLARLDRDTRARGARLGVLCEPVAGCRWLAALDCRGGRCSGATVGLGGRGPAPLDSVAPLDRLILGDGEAGLTALPPPGELPQ